MLGFLRCCSFQPWRLSDQRQAEQFGVSGWLVELIGIPADRKCNISNETERDRDRVSKIGDIDNTVQKYESIANLNSKLKLQWERMKQ